jgi:transcriptional regulator with XRE-family HTH domain
LPVPANRRKTSVNTANFGHFPQRFLQNVLDSKYHFAPHSHRASNCLPPKNVPTFLPIRTPDNIQVSEGVPVSAHTEKDSMMNSLEMDREVIRCKTCGLVQYRTRTGNCRRCVRALPQRMEYLIPQEPPQEEVVPETITAKFANQETVENIGQRIRQLRESRGMTQSQLQSRSKVSRSYLSRIESGQMTPSLGTLEKISEALSVGLNRFFIPESDGEALLEDPFIQGLRPFLRQLDWEQWQSILKRLQAISDHVNAAPITLRPIGNPARLPQPAPANGSGQFGHIGHASHSNGLMPAPAHGQPQGYPLRRPGMPVFQRPLAR